MSHRKEGHYGKGMQYGGAPRGFKPKPTRRVNYKTVICPDCEADIGDPCVTLSTGTVRDGHPVRKRMAIRLDNEMRNEVSL